MPGEKDVFVNQAYLTVVESAANTLTFNKLLTGTSIYEKVGWIISRIDYFFSVDSTNFGADNDGFDFGISVTDQITSVGMEYSGVLDWNRVKRVDLGTAGSGFVQRFPISKSFADLQGGGILVPPNPLFIFGKGIALTSAITLYARMFYTVKMLKVEDYWELVELRRMVGV
jgi:hypothetical protein